MGKIRVLVVDDSVFIRNALPKLLNSDKIEVVDVARNGIEAIEKACSVKPDIITMDIEMPVMNGLDALKEIMQKCPIPVLMLSALSREGARLTLDSLNLGAIDFIPKNSILTDINDLKEVLTTKIIEIAENTEVRNRVLRKNLIHNFKLNKDDDNGPVDIAGNLTRWKFTSFKDRPAGRKVKVVAIGISTGGPNALSRLIPSLPKNISASVLVIQHMPAYFTTCLADRLNSVSQLPVIEARDMEKLQPGTVHIAPGGRNIKVDARSRIKIFDDFETREIYRPSINQAIDSLIDVYGSSCLGVIMTGMGNDGSQAIKKLKKAGGYVICQSPETCVVEGMPSSVINNGDADEIHHLEDLPDAISSIFGLRAVRQDEIN